MPCEIPASGGNLRLVVDFNGPDDCFDEMPTVTAGKIIPCSTIDVKVDQPPQQSSALIPGRHSSQPFHGNKVISGTITGPCGVESIGFIAKMFLGTPDSTGNLHVFTVDSTAPIFIVSKEFTDKNDYAIYSGCLATTLSFTFNSNNELLYNLGFMAATQTLQDTPYDSNPESMADEVFFENPDIGAGSIQEGGSDANFEEVTINLNNNPAQSFGLSGGGNATYGVAGRLETSGSLRGAYINRDLVDKGVLHTETSIDVTLSKTSDYLRFYIPECQVSQDHPAVTSPNIVTFDLTFIGYYQDSDEESDIVIYLNNSRENYS